MKTGLKKLTLILGCSMLMVGQVSVMANAEETSVVQNEAKAALLPAANMRWEGTKIVFDNPNEAARFDFELYCDGAKVIYGTIRIADPFWGKGPVEHDFAKFFTKDGEYKIRVRATDGNGVYSDSNEAVQNYSVSQSTALPAPAIVSYDVDENKIAHITVSLPDEYVLGQDYQFTYVLYWKDVELTTSASHGATCDDLRISDEYHVVKVKAESLNEKYRNSADIAIYFNGQEPDEETDNNTSVSDNGCKHDFEWVPAANATATQNALEAYTCKKCGRVSEYMEVTNSAYAKFNKDAIQAIDKAPANGTVTIKTDMWVSFYESVIDTLKSRPDVTVVLNYFYKGTRYTLTIPAGADLSVLVDSEGYYGFRYLDMFFPGQEVK